MQQKWSLHEIKISYFRHENSFCAVQWAITVYNYSLHTDLSGGTSSSTFLKHMQPFCFIGKFCTSHFTACYAMSSFTGFVSKSSNMCHPSDVLNPDLIRPCHFQRDAQHLSLCYLSLPPVLPVNSSNGFILNDVQMNSAKNQRLEKKIPQIKRGKIPNAAPGLRFVIVSSSISSHQRT